MKNVLLLCGSTKPDSTNDKLLAFLANLLKEAERTPVYHDLKTLPYFEPGLTEAQLPATVSAFLEKIETAYAIIIASPEYVFSLPGILKNALEWTVETTVFSQKPVALIVAAASGRHALESLDLIISTLTQSPVPAERVLLLNGAGQYFDQKGQLTHADTKLKLTALVNYL